MHQTSVRGQTSCKCCFQPDEGHLLMIKCTFVRYDSHNQNPYKPSAPLCLWEGFICKNVS